MCSALPCERDFCQEANFSWNFSLHRHPPSRHTLGVVYLEVEEGLKQPTYNAMWQENSATNEM